MTKKGSKRTLWIASIVLVAILAVGTGTGLFTYSNKSPRMITAISVNAVTDTATITNTQTSFSTIVRTITTPMGNPSESNSCNSSNLGVCQVTVTPTCYNGNCQGQCPANGCVYNGVTPYYCTYYYKCYGQPYSYSNSPYYNYNVCQSNSSNTVQCSGYLYQDQNGCVELAVPFLAPWLETQAYQYYTLYNLPASYPPGGSWITVIGHLQQGYSAGSYPYGPACPGNSIIASSIS